MRNSYSLILSVALCLVFQGCEKEMSIEEGAVLGTASLSAPEQRVVQDLAVDVVEPRPDEQ